MVHVGGPMAGACVAEQVREEIAESAIQARIAEQRAVVALVDQLGGAVEAADRADAEDHNGPPAREPSEEDRYRDE
jgi:hypothetical protein